MAVALAEAGSTDNSSSNSRRGDSSDSGVYHIQTFTTSNILPFSSSFLFTPSFAVCICSWNTVFFLLVCEMGNIRGGESWHDCRCTNLIDSRLCLRGLHIFFQDSMIWKWNKRHKKNLKKKYVSFPLQLSIKGKKGYDIWEPSTPQLLCSKSVKLEPARKTKSNTKVLENDVMVEGI